MTSVQKISAGNDQGLIGGNREPGINENYSSFDSVTGLEAFK